MTELPGNCPTCGREVSSRYCPDCGERRLRPGDLTLGHLIGQAIETISNADGRIFLSVRDLVFRPGRLTASYIVGRRKPYLAPLPLFLLINVAFFAVQSIAGWRIFSTPLYSHLRYQIYSGAAQTMVADRLAAMQTTLERYAPVFDRAAELNAKSLIILMVPPFALTVWLFLGRRGRPFVTHVVFALHFFAFVLLLFCALLPVAKVPSWLGLGLGDSALDRILLLIQLALWAAYLWVAIGTTYGARGISRGLTVVALTAAATATLLGYRFAIFLITLYSTLPYAPPGWSWPAVSYDEPMLFVGQINCGELRGLPGAEKLPPSGLLAFFGDHDAVMGCDWAAGARVYYWPDIERLKPAIPPLEPSMIFPPCELRSRPFTDLPDPYSCVIDELVKDQEQVAHYARIRETIRNHGIPEELPYYCSFSKLFGWPSLIQKCDLELFRCETRADVHLLLQVDDYSNGEDSHGWGPGGSLYFLMHDRDLREHQFDRCEFEIQFT